MAKGDKFDCPRRVFTDERTGREVWKMTCWDDAHCPATYMYMQAFSADERYLIFASDRTGKYELYRLEVESGETVQVTDYAGRDETVPPRCNATADGTEMLYSDRTAFYAMNIETLEERIVAKLSNPWAVSLGGCPMCGCAGTRLVCFCKHEDGTTRILTADLRGSLLEEIYRWPDTERNLQHVQAANTEELVVTFALYPDFQNHPDDTPERRARAWKVDARTATAEPFLLMPPHFRATHEFWGPPGNPRLYFHKKTVPEWTPNWIASIDLNGGDYREHYANPTRPLGHSCITRDLKRLVTDVQHAESNELFLVDLETGRDEILCWPDSSLVDGVVGHVHPSFSPSGSKVLFTSDRDGKAAVYIVPL